MQSGLLEDRDGAGDENTGSDLASRGEEDHMVASRRDHRNTADAALARALVSIRLSPWIDPGVLDSGELALPPHREACRQSEREVPRQRV